MMNEKFMKLADQLTWESDVTYGELMRFAELLIRECLEQIDDGNSDHAGGNREAINRIKEHFGVE